MVRWSAMALVALVASLIVPSAAAQATSDAWSTHGPTGASVSELAIDPHHPATVYAGTQSGVFKTTDGGDRWRRLSGLPGLDVTALAISESDPDVLYVAEEQFQPSSNAVYRSTDAGATWKRVIANVQLATGTDFAGPEHIAIDPQDADVAYLATGRGGILKTADGGRTWVPANSGLELDTAGLLTSVVTVDPGRPQTLLACDHRGIARSTDGAASWHRIEAGLPRAPDIVTIAFDPSDPTVAYAGGYEGLFRSTDAGKSWSPSGLPVGGDVEPVGIAIAPSDPRVIYIWDAALGRIYRSQDGGESWKLSDQDLGPTNRMPIAVSPSVSSTVYAGNEYGTTGILKSVDSGRTWRMVNGGLTNSRTGWVVADPSRPDVVYAGPVKGTFGTIHKSTDGGATWTDLGLQACALAVDPSNPEVLYASNWTRLADGALSMGSIYRSDDGGLQWTYLQTLRRGSRTHAVTSLIVSTRNPDTIYAGVYSDGLYRSADGGLHWTRRPIGLRHERIVGMAMDPARPGTLYAALARTGVYRTRDGGLTWNEVLTLPGAESVAMDPSDPNRVYVGSRKAGVYATDDGGRGWTRSADGMDPSGGVTSIAVDPLDPSNVYAGVDGYGVFLSPDAGVHWEPFDEGLDDPRVTGLAFSSDGSVLHASTDGGGVFER